MRTREKYFVHYFLFFIFFRFRFSWNKSIFIIHRTFVHFIQWRPHELVNYSLNEGKERNDFRWIIVAINIKTHKYRQTKLNRTLQHFWALKQNLKRTQMAAMSKLSPVYRHGLILGRIVNKLFWINFKKKCTFSRKLHQWLLLIGWWSNGYKNDQSSKLETTT